MKKNTLISIFSIVFLYAVLSGNQRLENITQAVRSGDLTQIDHLIAQNQYTYQEYDMLIGDAEGLVTESKSWWLAVWIMMILGCLVAFMACLEALKLARKAPKYNSFTSLISGAFILILGAAGVYIAFKGFKKYTLYTKAHEIVLRLQAAKKNAPLK